MFVICLYFLQGMWYNFIGLPGSQLKEYDAAWFGNFTWISGPAHGISCRTSLEKFKRWAVSWKDWGSCLLRERWPSCIRPVSYTHLDVYKRQGQIRGAYLGGSILAFFLGYSMLFFKSGILASIYPFSAALILVGFDMSEYAGTTISSTPLLAVIGVGIMVLWAVLLLLMSSNKKEMKSRKQANAKGKGKRAVRRKGRW